VEELSATDAETVEAIRTTQALYRSARTWSDGKRSARSKQLELVTRFAADYEVYRTEDKTLDASNEIGLSSHRRNRVSTRMAGAAAVPCSRLSLTNER